MGEGSRTSPGATGSVLSVKFPTAPVLLADGPQLVIGGLQLCGSDPLGLGRRDPCGGHFWTGVSSVGADSATAE